MKRFDKLIYLILFLTLTLSCAEKKSSSKEVYKTELETDTLKFTSGIRTIFQDSKGNYWLGSREEGVCKFDGKSFVYFTINEGLSGNEINSIKEDNNGTVWIQSTKGISGYDGVKITNHYWSANSELESNWFQSSKEIGVYDKKRRTDPDSLENQAFKNEWKKSDTDLWFYNGNKEGVYRFDGQKLYYLAFLNPKVINPGSPYFITSISNGKNNMLWMGTYAGVFGYNGSQFTIINDETVGLNKTNTKGVLHIRSILEDSKGRLWIGNNGIGVLLRENDTIINFSEKNDLIDPASSRRGDKSKPGTLEHIFAIEEDGKGNIWFGDRDTGVWKYDGKTMTNYANVGQPNDFVHTIYKDKNDELWFLLTNGNVFKFNGKTFDKSF